MHGRLTEADIVVISGPIPRSPASPAASVCDFARDIPRVAQESEEVDACSYIFRLCKELQPTYLDRRGIDCLIDIDAGRLPEIVCRMLGLMVCELIKDASESTIAPRTLRVALRRRGDVCLCTISGQGAPDACTDPKPGLRQVRQLSAELDGGCMIKSMPDRGTVAIMFDARFVEPLLPAAIRRYRAGATGRSADGNIPASPWPC